MPFRFSAVVLPGSVFVTGACILVLEVVATRLLSPYFGNTLYTFSSVLSVVLGSLSIGYAYGGRLADRLPSQALFFRIIFFGGLSVFTLTGVAYSLLPLWGYSLPLRSGPLLVSLLLFTIPSVLLGLLSPFAISLQKRVLPDTGVGSVAGRLFFWSTLGSIAGSLSAGFLFIPWLGVQTTLLFVATTLTVLGGGGAVFSRARWSPLQLGLTILLAGIGFGLVTAPSANATVLHEEDGRYERIQVVEEELFGQPGLLLLLDRSLASGVNRETGAPLFPYTWYARLPHLQNNAPERAAVLGAGAYTVPLLLREEFPTITVDVVDVEPRLEPIAHAYFGLADDPSIRSTVTDARRFLYDSEEQYDLIFSDVYSSLYSLPSHLATQEFFTLADEKLSEDGLFIANLIGTLSKDPETFLPAILHTARTVWPESMVFVTQSQTSLTPQNVLLVAGKGNAIPFDPCAESISLDAPFDTLCADQLDLDRLPLSQAPLLTDVHSPVEHLSRHLLRDYARQDSSFHADEALQLSHLLQEDSEDTILNAELSALGASIAFDPDGLRAEFGNGIRASLIVPHRPETLALVLETLRADSFQNNTSLTILFSDTIPAEPFLQSFCTDFQCSEKAMNEGYDSLLTLLKPEDANASPS